MAGYIMSPFRHQAETSKISDSHDLQFPTRPYYDTRSSSSAPTCASTSSQAQPPPPAAWWSFNMMAHAPQSCSSSPIVEHGSHFDIVEEMNARYLVSLMKKTNASRKALEECGDLKEARRERKIFSRNNCSRDSIPTIVYARSCTDTTCSEDSSNGRERKRMKMNSHHATRAKRTSRKNTTK